MAFKAGDSVPYAPPATVIEVLRRYRDRGLPTPVTSEVLERAGVPETLSQRTLQALKLLGFIDSEGNPAAEFEAANRTPEEQYKESMRDLVCGVYSEAITFADPSTDSYDRVRDAFRAYNPKGQQERMIPLFLGLLEFVGIDVSAAVSSRSKKSEGTGSTGKSNGTAGKSTPRQATQKTPKQGSSSRSKDGDQHQGEDDAGLPPGLVGLLKQIPRDGKTWTTMTRNAFLEAFAAVLNYTIPVDDSPPPKKTADSDGAQEDAV